MNNQDFIRKYSFYMGQKRHGNLFVKDTVMYSYGYHYPLLFEVNGLKFVNNKGYSNSTSKHINYASSQAQYNVKLEGRDISYDGVLQSLLREKERINNDINNCVRHTSMKKDMLLQSLENVNYTISVLENSMG